MLEIKICVYLLSEYGVYCWKHVLYDLLIKVLAKAMCEVLNFVL